MSTESPEFSRIVRANELGKAGISLEINPTEEEREALAERLGIIGLPELSGEIEVKRWRKGGAKLVAHVKATMRRKCVVSLEEFDASFEGDFEARFASPTDEIGMAGDLEGELFLDPENDDPPEVLDGDKLDAGEAVAQFLVLNLDPYPRRPGVEFEENVEEPQKTSPFAVLEGLKGDGSGGDKKD